MFTLQELKICLGSLYSFSKLVKLYDVFNSFFRSNLKTTTRGLSRYSSMSLRSWFRFLSISYNWIVIRVSFFAHFCFDINAVYILVADETVEGKSGNGSYGISKFYSGTAGRAINGVCFFGMSLVNTSTRNSYLLGAQQVVYSEADKARIAQKKANKVKSKGKSTQVRGRKKGVKNKEKVENPTASFRVFKTLLNDVFDSLLGFCPKIKIGYLVLDSAYGTLDYQELSQGKKIPIISKLKSTAALYLPYIQDDQKVKSKGRPPIYGKKLAMDSLPTCYLKQTENEQEYKIETYQLKAYAKNSFGAKILNIVIQNRTRISDGKVANNIWFSSDLELHYEHLLDYYSLRFQIEFDFRDAKQYFGLSDFKNYKESNLTNFVNLSFTMCLIAKIQLAHYRKILNEPKLSITDLKLIYKAQFTAKNILKLVRSDANLIFNDDFCNQFIPQDLIHAA